ncbi:putative 2-oxoglutarate-dependent dioxygenase [Penicillium robsamsonii]|uniref:putative 2-oxoglutarate-dependent dioxygenase n=1 Tax=Penicillium robsamsonii TaxID=1792511 RepID=UPI002548FC05|nr:putative 2-oxoglutarate-dependent dioxygenase [Penicillium robsamsonii]KAJ5816772.1 putative 2-oxoglutarate-dependent dioxygenase [Penicillium robsamsonii]
MEDGGFHTDGGHFTNIPVLDYDQTTQPNARQEFLARLREALVNVGFLYLKNPPVPIDVQETLVQKAKEMFELPLEKKQQLEMVNSKHFLGYTPLGNEKTIGETDHRESFDFSTECLPPSPEEPLYCNLRGPNQWPSESDVPGGRDAVEAYLSAIGHLADDFKILIAEALDMPSTSFVGFFDNLTQNKLKLVKYPPPKPSYCEELDHTRQGVGIHKDASFLTFLLQGTSHLGLEVQNKGGRWIPVPPIPGTLVINIGRSLEAITHGLCTATTHRVNLRPENFLDRVTKQSLGPRYSFPVFQGLALDLTRAKMNLEIPPHIRDLNKNIQVKSDAESYLNHIFQGCIGQGSFTARLAAHPDVGRRWYPDSMERVLEGQRTIMN